MSTQTAGDGAADDYDAARVTREVAHAASVKSVYVYQAPVRIWHWINVLAVVLLCVTGYFIGSPPPTQPGEASAHFLMGYIRFVHFASAYVFAIGLAARIYWACVGNRHAREMFWVPLLTRAYWVEVWSMVQWYSFARAAPGRYVGHNPLARFAMFFMFFLTSVFMVLTGFAMYAEGQQRGSWADRLFGWVIPLLGQSQDAHTWHHLGMWVLIVFIILHVYAAIREDIMGRSSVVSTMISGYRTFKGEP